jgi:2-isopropylmalate synthase
VWEVPYLPLDPADVGRTYESVVRVNSQSGKGGIAFLLERDYDLVLPRRLQIEFSQIVQKAMDASGKEMSSADIWQLFEQEYLQACTPLKYMTHHLSETDDYTGVQNISVRLQLHEKMITLHGQGNGPIDAFVNALGLGVQIHHYEERSRNGGSNADAIAYVEIAGDLLQGSLHGVGIHSNIVTASILAILSAVNRALLGVNAQMQAEILKSYW